MIYITGDTHVPYDIGRLSAHNFPQQKELTKDDYVVICGDFGGVWTGGNTDKDWLEWLEDKPFTTLFVDGNHENFPLLNGFPEEEWHSGRIHRLRPSVIHLMRGQIFEIDGLKCFAMGGASSHDKDDRVEGIDWWPEEMPDDAEMKTALDNLKTAGWKVNIVLTHCAPAKVQCMLSSLYAQDALTNFFQYIDEELDFDAWYFGHYHADREVDAKHRALYNDIIRIR